MTAGPARPSGTNRWLRLRAGEQDKEILRLAVPAEDVPWRGSAIRAPKTLPVVVRMPSALPVVVPAA